MNRPFNAWKTGAPYYVPCFAIGIAVLAGTGWTAYGYASLPFLIAGVFALNFFRDPRRRIPEESDGIVSPADGTVVAIEDLEESEHYGGPCRRISIFLSVFSVHVNRAPVDGSVTGVKYKKGLYRNAMSAESSRVNESNAIWLETAGGPMTVRQISGAIARRIVCVPEAGDRLVKGQRIGMIKFGSRTELYLPRDTEVCVRVKEKVRGGSSIVARWNLERPGQGG